jgi:hypothetical protein
MTESGHISPEFGKIVDEVAYAMLGDSRTRDDAEESAIAQSSLDRTEGQTSIPDWLTTDYIRQIALSDPEEAERLLCMLEQEYGVRE